MSEGPGSTGDAPAQRARPVSEQDSPFLRACRRQPTSTVPVWFMRQAGRALPEYRRLRGDRPILESIAQPELAAELTLQPVRRYGVDAAILFSDIVVPLAAIGFGVEVLAGRGPVAARPFGGPADLARLRPLEPEADVPYVIEAVQMAAAQLDVPLIGLAGGPFTLASYLIEGGPSKDHARTKVLMRSDPGTWERLMASLSEISLAFLQAQLAAGASAVQLFDSWVGTLSPRDYAERVLPHTRRIFESLRASGAPLIHFGLGAGHLLELMAQAGADVVSVDWRVSLDEARRRLGASRAVQGNLDPATCLAPWPVIAQEARRVLAEAGAEPGHIFNLGHGVLPDTDPDNLARLVELVHTEGGVR